MSELCFQSAVNLQRMVRDGEISCLELLEAHLAQQQRTNGVVNAIVTHTDAAARAAAAGGGRVVFIASSAALAGYAYVSAYAASKHALLGYARCAALELARHHIGVNVVCPYYVDSPMTDASAARIGWINLDEHMLLKFGQPLV